jgi:P pilus assembly chaperone PapD
MIYPKRLIFNTNHPQSLFLINNNKDTMYYKTSICELYQNDSTYSLSYLSNDSLAKELSKNIILYPKHFKIPPNEQQTIKIKFKNNNDSIDNIYGVMFTPIPNFNKNETDTNNSTAGISIKVVVTSVIPIIHKISKAKNIIKINSAQVIKDNDTTFYLNVSIEKNIKAYSISTITVYDKPKNKRNSKKISETYNVVLYPNVLKRLVKVKFNNLYKGQTPLYIECIEISDEKVAPTIFVQN